MQGGGRALPEGTAEVCPRSGLKKLCPSAQTWVTTQLFLQGNDGDVLCAACSDEGLEHILWQEPGAAPWERGFYFSPLGCKELSPGGTPGDSCLSHCLHTQTQPLAQPQALKLLRHRWLCV